MPPDALDLAMHLHRGGAWGYWWQLPAKRTTWFPANAPTPPPFGSPTDLYHAVHPTAAKRGDYERGRLEDVAAVNCLFGEFDCSATPAKDAMLVVIRRLDPPPSLIVDSGGGFHVYWFLDAPFFLDTPRARTFAQQLQARWVESVGGDPGAKDLARVLRVPGSTNYKYDPPRPVVFVEAHFDRRYDLAALATACGVEDSRAKVTETVRPSPNGEAAWESVFGPADLARAHDLLAQVDPAFLHYKDWLAAGMALHHEFGDDGLTLWDAWSMRDPARYKRGDCARRWASFRRDARAHPVTLGSLVHLVRERQEVPPAGPAAEPAPPPSAAALLPFPEEGFVGVAADYANLYAEFTEASRPALYFTFLTYLGAMLAPRVFLESELRPWPALFTVVIGPSGTPRKSVALRLTDTFFQECVAGFGDFVHHGAGSAEGLARHLGRDEDTGAVRPLLLYLDEFRMLLDKARTEGSIVAPLLCTLFDYTRFDNSTKGGRIKVRDGYLSLIAACTTETYATAWVPALVNIGLPNRLWLVVGEPTHPVALPRPVPQDRRDVIACTLDDHLDALAKTSGVLRLTEDARARWETWYAQRPRTLYSVRLDTYGWRLMLLLSVSRGHVATVSLDTVERVCLLLDHQHQLRQFLDPVDAENVIARLEESCRRYVRQAGTIKIRDLKRAVNASRFGIWMFTKALDNLAADGEVKRGKLGKADAVAWIGETEP
jgi:hypothetical protein